MNEATSPDLPHLPAELTALSERYQFWRRLLRWGGMLLLPIWLLWLVAGYDLLNSAGNAFSTVAETSFDHWLSGEVVLFGNKYDRYTCLLVLLAGLTLVTKATVLYSYHRLRRLRQAFKQLSKRPPLSVTTSIPHGLADQPAERDALGFDLLARAVAGLLRHPATQAPYSLVLSGDWGSGKSSLMGQIRYLLAEPEVSPADAGPGRAGRPDAADEAFAPGEKVAAFQCLWFNVWHFQSEQHLLATFLGSILEQCQKMPGFYRRLWWQRLREQGFWTALRLAFVLAMLLPLVAGLLCVLLELAWPGGHDYVLELASSFGEKLGQADKATVLALAATWGGAAWSLLRAWQERTQLLSGLIPVARFRLEAAHADVGFRRKYQKEFRQLMRSTPAGTRFLVFIDDVDRIPGSRVLELLECLNFITDTASRPAQDRQQDAELYFVLGMYVPEVARTLGQALDAKGSLGEVPATRHALRFLAKMVDLVVPLPDLQGCSAEQLTSLLFGDAAAGRAVASTQAPEA